MRKVKTRIFRNTTAEFYSKHCKTSVMKRFCKNSERLKVGNYFHKTLYLRYLQGSEYAPAMPEKRVRRWGVSDYHSSSWARNIGILTFQYIMSQNGQTHSKNLAAFAARYL